MICQRCKGKGWAIVLVKQKEGFYHTEQAECPECHGKGFVEQTNEEWFDTLSTEEKAEVLYKFYCDGRNDELQVYVSINANSFKEWLKQPHHEKE